MRMGILFGGAKEELFRQTPLEVGKASVPEGEGGERSGFGWRNLGGIIGKKGVRSSPFGGKKSGDRKGRLARSRTGDAPA